MKKNAIAIASIMFVAGCATNGRYTGQTDSALDTSDVALSRSEMIASSDPSLSAQYDPASGGFDGYVSGSDSSSIHRNYTSVNDYHADSSVQGGSNQARGWDGRRDLRMEEMPHPLNPAVQADSSIRGGSMQARQSDWYSQGPFEPAAPRSNRIKADSSTRGGSNQARYPQYQSSLERSAEQSVDQPDSYAEYLAIIPEDSGTTSSADLSDKSDSVLGSANWNPSDDMLPDGTLTQPSELRGSQPNNDASVGGAATSESGSASSTKPCDDIDWSNADVPASGRDISGISDISSSQASSSVSISPSYSSSTSGSTDVQDSATSTAVGGPGSTETGSASSSSTFDSSTPVLPTDVSRESYSLFNNNRAQGVGSAATGELGIANGGLDSELSDDQLASQVKSMIMRETTGTEGISQREFAREVQITGHNGDIVLKGTVPSQKAKDSIEIRAREISGVHRVDNQLTVSEQSESPIYELNTGRNLEDTSSRLHGLDHIRE